MQADYGIESQQSRVDIGKNKVIAQDRFAWHKTLVIR